MDKEIQSLVSELTKNIPDEVETDEFKSLESKYFNINSPIKHRPRIKHRQPNEEERYCNLCDAKLGMWNESDYCLHHDFDEQEVLDKILIDFRKQEKK